MEQRKFAEAQNELLVAIKLKPDYGIAYGDLAFAASENKNYALALKALDTRAKFLPEIPVDAVPARHLVRSSAGAQAGGGQLSSVPGGRRWKISGPGVAGAASSDRHRTEEVAMKKI